MSTSNRIAMTIGSMTSMTMSEILGPIQILFKILDQPFSAILPWKKP